MSIIRNIIKRNVTNLLNEGFGEHDDTNVISKSGSVTHDKVASHSAKASITIDKIKDNLRSMGVSTSDVNDIYTIDQLKSKPFDIKFTVLGKENKWGERKKKDISTRAKYNKSLSESRGTLVLDLKDYGTMVFLKKHLNMNLPGTDKTLKGLANGKNYRVQSLNGVLAIKLNEQGEQKDSTHVIELHDINLGDGGESNKSKGEKLFVSGEIHNVDTKNPNSEWVSSNIINNVNNQLDSGGVRVEKSLSKKNTLVLIWDSPMKLKNGKTDAMLVSAKFDVWNALNGDVFRDKEVTIGRKIGGVEEMEKDTKVNMTLRIIN
jgi:hypothetical protein